MPRPLPELFKSVVAAGFLALAASTLNVIGLFPFSSYSGYLFALLALLSNIGLTFVAQFRAEQTAKDEG